MITLRLSLACAISLASQLVHAAPATPAPTCLITPDSVGPVRLGMTVRQAMQAYPAARFERSSDGDGAALIGVTRGKEELMTLHASEEDADKPVDVSKKISSIETFHPNCRSADGIAPGMLIKHAEKILGKTTDITLSEIESREYIEFAKQSRRFGYRLDYAGVFKGAARHTRKYAANARLLSIAIAKPGNE